MSFNFSIENNFITNEESKKLVDYFTPKLRHSGTLSDKKQTYSKIRTSSDYYIEENLIQDEEVKRIINSIKNKISKHSGQPVQNQELLNIIRYLPGEEFKEHYDAFDKTADYWKIESKLGGQRIKTYIICLQKAKMGGYTGFTKIDKNILLEQGQCIYWDNVDKSGQIFTESLHCGRCPIDGEKWILTCWIRENKYVAINRNNI